MADENAMALVRTTVATQDQAKTLAKRLVTKRLACCVHLQRIDSWFRWEDKVQEQAEWSVEARVPQEKVEDAWLAVAKDHPYDTPLAEIVPETRVNGKYAQWARQVTGLAD